MESPERLGRDLVVVAAGFEELASPDVRLLDEASRLGSVHVRLWSDALAASLSGEKPAFSEAERRFVVANLRYVESVGVVASPESAVDGVRGRRPSIVIGQGAGAGAVRSACDRSGTRYLECGSARLAGFPSPAAGLLEADSPAAPRVVVTGCFDRLHSGHVEFFRDAAALGELYVVVGSDRNVRLLKGAGHPLHTEAERAYMVQAVRAVHRAMISTGSGWMDAEPEIGQVEPQIYVVNEDGDKPEKREFCRSRGLEYVLLRRRPHPGLPRRTSTELRGF